MEPLAALAETVAVKITVWPMLDGLELDTKAVVVLALFTVWASAGDVLAP
jgi:hypothetical protein